MEQGTQEWFAARCGFVTASKIADLMAKTKTGEAASRANYLAKIVAERLTGKPAESFSNASMQWGTDTEPMARTAYELRHGVLVDQVGFVPHPEIKSTGASPDGLVGDCGLVEIKCPNTATHIEYLFRTEPPTKYQLQMLWQMECTGRDWCDFVSFDPRMPENMQLYVCRFERDQKRINEIKEEVKKFLLEVDHLIKSLQEIY